MVYKLVAVDGRPVEKRSAAKQSHGGRKSALRRHKDSGTATEEVILVAGTTPRAGPAGDGSAAAGTDHAWGSAGGRPAHPRTVPRTAAAVDGRPAVGGIDDGPMGNLPYPPP